MQYNINTIVYNRYKDKVPLHPLTASWQCQPRMSCSAEPASAPGTLPAAVGTPPPSEREGEPHKKGIRPSATWRTSNTHKLAK